MNDVFSCMQVPMSVLLELYNCLLCQQCISLMVSKWNYCTNQATE